MIRHELHVGNYGTTSQVEVLDQRCANRLRLDANRLPALSAQARSRAERECHAQRVFALKVVIHDSLSGFTAAVPREQRPDIDSPNMTFSTAHIQQQHLTATDGGGMTQGRYSAGIGGPGNIGGPGTLMYAPRPQLHVRTGNTIVPQDVSGVRHSPNQQVYRSTTGSPRSLGARAGSDTVSPATGGSTGTGDAQYGSPWSYNASAGSTRMHNALLPPIDTRQHGPNSTARIVHGIGNRREPAGSPLAHESGWFGSPQSAGSVSITSGGPGVQIRSLGHMAGPESPRRNNSPLPMTGLGNRSQSPSGHLQLTPISRH